MRSFQQELVGVFGDPVAENPTQVMMEAAFRALEMPWRYLTVRVRVEGLRDAVRGAVAMGWRGFNCTIPHKIAVVGLLDRLSPGAELIGAVNCVRIVEGQLEGENTDGKGFVESVQTLRPVRGLRAMVIGAGGAARAIACELALAGAAAVTIAARRPDQAESLARHVMDRTGVRARGTGLEAELRCPEGTELVVNATSIGLAPDVEARVPLNLDSIAAGSIVADVIPNPPRTRLLREAAERELRTLDGLGMLVNQGVLGLAYWSGRQADPRVMQTALSTVFGQMERCS